MNQFCLGEVRIRLVIKIDVSHLEIGIRFLPHFRPPNYVGLFGRVKLNPSHSQFFILSFMSFTKPTYVNPQKKQGSNVIPRGISSWKIHPELLLTSSPFLDYAKPRALPKATLVYSGNSWRLVGFPKLRSITYPQFSSDAAACRVCWIRSMWNTSVWPCKRSSVWHASRSLRYPANPRLVGGYVVGFMDYLLEEILGTLRFANKPYENMGNMALISNGLKISNLFTWPVLYSIRIFLRHMAGW